MSIANPKDLEGFLRIGQIVGQILGEMQLHVAPGVTTAELDGVCREALARHGARSTSRHQLQFPGHACISVNDEIVHGVPGERIVNLGDLVKLDLVADLDGYVADAARTVVVGTGYEQAERLMTTARAAFDRALPFARAGHLIRAVGRAIESEARRNGCRVYRELTGHGVGRRIHEPPEIFNYEEPRCMGRFVEGMVVAIEPIVTMGSGRSVTDCNGWTVHSTDRSIAAHFEETVVITKGMPLILTAA